MASERLKDLREWGTFVMSAVAVILIPIGIVVLKNQRLEIKQEISETYISKEAFTEYRENHRASAENDRTTLRSEIATQNAKTEKVEAKMDAIGSKVDAALMSLNTLQSQMTILNQRGTAPSPPR